MDPRSRQALDTAAKAFDFRGIDLVDVNTLGASGVNALHILCIFESLEKIEALIGDGIDIHQTCDHGTTPLHWAAMSGRMDVVELLVNHGADLYATAQGDTPLMLARNRDYQEICNYLESRMAAKGPKQRDAHIKARIDYLRRQISKLEAALEPQTAGP